MKKILLLDYDHTLYPSTLTTLKAVDDRINLYIRTFLGFSEAEADEARTRLWDKYGTTLKGLEELHGVDREHYCDFIHAIEEHHLPPPDPRLHEWLARMPHPFYIFTNARMDWAVRGLKAMGLGTILPQGMETAARAATDFLGPRLEGIFDIAFMDWEGKPNRQAYAKVDAHLRERHGPDIRVHFADDRQDNLESARERGWSTIWIAPHTAPKVVGDEFDRVASSLTDIDPESLA
ncbi:MAG: Pyrimidine 5-nucleotidase [Fibrobacteres bacterium]|nr:Pyrimidine 5-nucleotidase [Fibrobacterota bacterium]